MHKMVETLTYVCYESDQKYVLKLLFLHSIAYIFAGIQMYVLL